MLIARAVARGRLPVCFAARLSEFSRVSSPVQDRGSRQWASVWQLSWGEKRTGACGCRAQDKQVARLLLAHLLRLHRAREIGGTPLQVPEVST